MMAEMTADEALDRLFSIAVEITLANSGIAEGKPPEEESRDLRGEQRRRVK